MIFLVLPNGFSPMAAEQLSSKAYWAVIGLATLDALPLSIALAVPRSARQPHRSRIPNSS